MTDTAGFAVTVDCTGLLCPLPVYKAGVALERMQAGEALQLVCTDPGSLADIPAMARQRGDTLVSVEEREGIQVFVLRKGGAA